MIFHLFENDISNIEKKYHKYSDGNLECYYRGIIYQKGFTQGYASVKNLIDLFRKTNNIDLNQFYGAFHMIIIDKVNMNNWFFTDNSGNCCFYYDENNRISDSFIDLVNIQKSVTPNFKSIMEFIAFGCIYSEETVCNEIKRTNAKEIYYANDSKIRNESKKIHFYGGALIFKDLKAFMTDFKHAVGSLRLGAIITGGSDSRVTLAHLLNLNIPCDLIISGNDKNKDVIIAKEIASKLNKKIHVSDEFVDTIDKETLYNLFLHTDGVDGFISRYRLYKKSIMVKELDLDLEIGGAGGELYKNGFLNQELPFFNSKKINKNKFYRMKLNPSQFDSEYLSKEMFEQQCALKERIIDKFFSRHSQSDEKYQYLFNIGSDILKYRMIAISNSNNLTLPSISPFTEIDVLKLTYSENPWRLELNQWQRKEISNHCLDIANLKTDRGTTLINNKAIILLELFRTYFFLAKIALKRLLLKANKKSEKLQINNKNEFCISIRKSDLYTFSMNICKDLGILNEKCSIDQIPIELGDRLLTVGLVFSYKKYFNI